MATLINGDGNAAVYAAQDSDWFAGVEGNTTKILKVGAKMEYEIEDANTIAIKNGVLVTKEGRRVQIDAGAIDEFIIPTGTQGVTRYFIIGYHLYTDASSNQLCETFVQLMANGTDTIPEDTFRGGSTDVYVSLYRVKQDGITLDTIQSLLPEGVDLDGIGDEIDDIKDDIDQINSDLTELNDYSYNHYEMMNDPSCTIDVWRKGNVVTLCFNWGGQTVYPTLTPLFNYLPAQYRPCQAVVGALVRVDVTSVKGLCIDPNGSVYMFHPTEYGYSGTITYVVGN